jgi:hypothetical protein
MKKLNSAPTVYQILAVSTIGVLIGRNDNNQYTEKGDEGAGPKAHIAPNRRERISSIEQIDATYTYDALGYLIVPKRKEYHKQTYKHPKGTVTFYFEPFYGKQ